MNPEFVQNALSYGDAGKAWLENIPKIIAKYGDEWSILVSPPYSLSYNYVAPSVLENDKPAVLKIGFPNDVEFQHEIDALLLCDGDGMEKVLQLDRSNSVMLLEQVDPGTPLSSLDEDSETTRIIAKVMKQIHKELPTGHSFPTVAKWAEAFPKYHKNFPKGSAIPEHLIVRAQDLFTQLLATSQPSKLLHGDLHHDNVLASSRSGWLAIDPKGVVGEPAYEVAAMIRNPYEKVKHIVDLKPFLQNRIKILADELEMDPKRILQWCLAQTVLSGIWNLEGAKGPEHCVRVAQALYEME